MPRIFEVSGKLSRKDRFIVSDSIEEIKVFGYVRVSTTGQVKEGFSLEQQKEEISRFCQDNGYELVRIYEDAGISGAKVNEDDLSITRERNTKKLMIDPNQVEVVRYVFKMKKQNPNITLDEIAISLHEVGFTTSSGRRYHRAQIKRILDNRNFYVGLYSYDGIYDVAGQHEIIEGITKLVYENWWFVH